MIYLTIGNLLDYQYMDKGTDGLTDRLVTGIINWQQGWAIKQYKNNIYEGFNISHSGWFLSNCFNNIKELVEDYEFNHN
jgi:hypothetical protein